MSNIINDIMELGEREQSATAHRSFSREHQAVMTRLTRQLLARGVADKYTVKEMVSIAETIMAYRVSARFYAGRRRPAQEIFNSLTRPKGTNLRLPIGFMRHLVQSGIRANIKC